MQVSELAAVAIAIAGSVTDLRTRKIPNALTFGAAAGGFAFFLLTKGWAGLGWSAGGWLLGGLLFLPMFALRGMGGGDVKLLAALGAWLGPSRVIWLALYTAIAGGVFALIVALSRGYARQAFANVGSLLMFWRVAGLQPHPALTIDSATAVRLPYAIPIAAGLAVTLWLR